VEESFVGESFAQYIEYEYEEKSAYQFQDSNLTYIPSRP
jgi:hypothetical protein